MLLPYRCRCTEGCGHLVGVVNYIVGPALNRCQCSRNHAYAGEVYPSVEYDFIPSELSVE